MQRAEVTNEQDAVKDLGDERTRPSWLQASHSLPFSNLSPDEFEVFSFLLLLKEYPDERILYHGKTNDAGRDIVHERPDGTVRLIQCKHYAANVGAREIRTELAKVYCNVFDKTIPRRPDEIVFYVTPDLTSPASDLLEDERKWDVEAEKALRLHLGHEPGQALLQFARSWRPTFNRENALCLTERCKKFPELREEFFAVKKVVDASRDDISYDMEDLIRPVLEGIERIEGSLSPGSKSHLIEPAHVDQKEVKEAFQQASRGLLAWPTTLKNGVCLPRNEVSRLLEIIQSRDSSTTVLLGVPGSGKSAVLAVLGAKAKNAGLSVLAVKADKLSKSVDSQASLAQELRLPALPADCVRAVAVGVKVLVMLDQLDALADLVDLHSERLNVLLESLRRIHGERNVHVVCSCRQFDFRHDVRFGEIEADQLELSLPPWVQVLEVLRNFGIDACNWPEPLQESLRPPQHLKVFLSRFRGTSEDLVFRSYQDMLDDLWRQKVINVDGPQGRSELLLEMACIMAQEEVLWLPAARFDDRESLIQSLVAAGVLARPEDGPRVGFEHQTLMEHARARSFAGGMASLAEHIRDRQDSLFVRPTIWATLRYLRQASNSTYHSEVSTILAMSPRRHIHQLIVDFLGQVEQPSDREERWLLDYLRDDTYRDRTLSAIRGNQDWFNRLEKAHLPAIMNLPQKKCWQMVWVIAAAWSFARRRCLDLITEHWPNDKEKDGLTWKALLELKEWDDEALELACLLARRSSAQSSAVFWMAQKIRETAPELAPRLIAAAWEERITTLERSSSGTAGDTPDGEPLSDVFARPNLTRDSFVEMLDDRKNGYEWEQLAQGAPRAVIETLWPLFVRIVEHVVGERHYILGRFRQDACTSTFLDAEDPGSTPASVMDEAVRLFAAQTPEDFLQFLGKWESIDATVVQRILARGLTEIASRYPVAVLDFLTDDDRRLELGDALDGGRDTVRLIATVSPHLSDEHIGRLEEVILRLSRFNPDYEGDGPDWLDHCKEYNQELQIQLLLAMPKARLSGGSQALLASNANWYRDLQRRNEEHCRVSLIESPMSTDEMLASGDDDILSLFNEVPDSTRNHHPRDWMVGGSVQAGQAFGEFAKQQPDRAAGILKHFRSGEQEWPVASAMRPLAQSSYASDQLFRLILDLDALGFRGEDFRGEAADASVLRAAEPGGLPDQLCCLFERWLGENWRYDSQDKKQATVTGGTRTERRSTIWLNHETVMIPQGPYQVLHALTVGYLLREPAEADRWLRVISKRLECDDAPETWLTFGLDLVNLRLCNRNQAVNFLNRLFQKYPMVRDNYLGAVLIGRLRGFMPDDKLQHFLHAIRDSEWTEGPQAYGELLALCSLTEPNERWVSQEIDAAVDSSLTEAQSREIRVGLAISAARLWGNSRSRSRATDLILKLITTADEVVAQEIMAVFAYTDVLLADVESRRLLTAIADTPMLLSVAGENHLVDMLEDVVTFAPDLTHRLCSEIVKRHGEHLADITSSWALTSASITSIAITLQRLGGEFREKGLTLFEDLLSYGVPSAQATLLELDHRQASPHTIYRRPRRRKYPAPSKQANS